MLENRRKEKTKQKMLTELEGGNVTEWGKGKSPLSLNYSENIVKVFITGNKMLDNFLAVSIEFIVEKWKSKLIKNKMGKITGWHKKEKLQKNKY